MPVHASRFVPAPAHTWALVACLLCATAGHAAAEPPAPASPPASNPSQPGLRPAPPVPASSGLSSQERAAADCRAALTSHPLRMTLAPGESSGAYALHLEFFAPVPVRVAWQAMTDYDAMASYMPDMQRSVVQAVDGDTLRVLQQGSSGVGPLRVSVRTLLDVTLHGHVASWVTVSGDLDTSGQARAEARDGGSVVRYTALLRPRMWLPPLLGPWFLRRQIQRQMTALREHMCVLLGQAAQTARAAPASPTRDVPAPTR
ncbi:MAG: SRPBCC family protein [Betaproteobacteria bacterium]|uniref:SRPBCC family protein n=1 Tax=Thiomonas delicata TaxID=364030 RepID=UPI001647A926|nr:SRPBCC family protein [Thiomonas delicata]MDE2128859.1 SRPBCC family protein [Betaproteobacteria bacterium]